MKTKKVDFLIRYEHKVRDLESIMLIRTELERRGYSVAFICNYEYNPCLLYTSPSSRDATLSRMPSSA